MCVPLSVGVCQSRVGAVGLLPLPHGVHTRPLQGGNTLPYGSSCKLRLCLYFALPACQLFCDAHAPGIFPLFLCCAAHLVWRVWDVPVERPLLLSRFFCALEDCGGLVDFFWCVAKVMVETRGMMVQQEDSSSMIWLLPALLFAPRAPPMQRPTWGARPPPNPAAVVTAAHFAQLVCLCASNRLSEEYCACVPVCVK